MTSKDKQISSTVDAEITDNESEALSTHSDFNTDVKEWEMAFGQDGLEDLEYEAKNILTEEEYLEARWRFDSLIGSKPGTVEAKELDRLADLLNENQYESSNLESDMVFESIDKDIDEILNSLHKSKGSK